MELMELMELVPPMCFYSWSMGMPVVASVPIALSFRISRPLFVTVLVVSPVVGTTVMVMFMPLLFTSGGNKQSGGSN
jgi:hypothetical protein